MNHSLSQNLHEVVKSLSAQTLDEKAMFPQRETLPPSRDTLVHMLDLIKSVLFPGFFDVETHPEMRSYFVGVNIDLLYTLLQEQIKRALQFRANDGLCDVSGNSTHLALEFLNSLPEIKRLLLTDVQAIYDNDPAVGNYEEVVSCYPVVQAMIHYRTAHQLLKLGVPVIPRIVTEMAHSATGIDIHPGACIGEYFAIDHGTGVVIGETCCIGNHVTLYQGVTLGAKNFTLDSEGRPINMPRHPILEDYVTVYSNSTLLGRITIGHHSVIGGNVWLTHSVEPESRILQSKASSLSFRDGLGI